MPISGRKQMENSAGRHLEMPPALGRWEMLVVGLTGGIATGKSTVSAFFAEAGAEIVDADKIAHAAVTREQPAWARVVAHFGKEVLLPDGEIDRKRLGEIIFNNPAQKERLNAIVHPVVTEETARQLDLIARRSPHAVTILDVPLLIEAGMHEGLADIIVVYIPEALQVTRLMIRDGIARAAALARVRSQMPIEEKRRYATLLIDNSGPLGVTRERSLEVYRCLKARAQGLE